MSDHYLTFRLYVERKPVTAEWCRDLLRRLWAHGVEFGPFSPQTATWDGQLHTTRPAASSNAPALSLDQDITNIASQGAGELRLWDKGLDILLALDTNLSRAAYESGDPDLPNRRAFGTITFSIDTGYLRASEYLPRQSNAPSRRDPLSPAEQYYKACLHWFEVLCRETEAAFGFGYVASSDLLDENAFEDGSDGGVDGAVDTALRQGHVPDLHQWLSVVRAEYVAARYATPDLLSTWLASPEQWVKRLSTGAMLMSQSLQPYEYGAAELHVSLARETASQQRADARAHYRRAMAIYEANGDAGGVQYCQEYLKALGG